MNTDWTSNIKTVSKCGMAPESIDIILSDIFIEKVKLLLHVFPKTEWLAYLKGRKLNYWTVEDLLIPKQCVDMANVDVIPDSELSKIKTIGVVHSHHHMMNNFSHTDNESINSNHIISLLVTHEMITGQFRYETKCGAMISVPVDPIMQWTGNNQKMIVLYQTCGFFWFLYKCI